MSSRGVLYITLFETSDFFTRLGGCGSDVVTRATRRSQLPLDALTSTDDERSRVGFRHRRQDRLYANVSSLSSADVTGIEKSMNRLKTGSETSKGKSSFFFFPPLKINNNKK